LRHRADAIIDDVSDAESRELVSVALAAFGLMACEADDGGGVMESH
jgi:hypothetical protein